MTEDEKIVKAIADSIEIVSPWLVAAVQIKLMGEKIELERTINCIEEEKKNREDRLLQLGE